METSTQMPKAISQRSALDKIWEDIVVSILSVNQYSLQRTYDSIQGLRREKITDAKSLARWKAQEIEERLKAAGCDRGPFMTKLFAERLAALGALIRTKCPDECEKVIASRDVDSIEGLLLPVKGIGPVVLRNLYSLRQIPSPSR